MKKLFAIIAAVSAAMAMAITLVSCGGDTGTGYACLDEPIVKKATPTPNPEPEPDPKPTPEPADTTQVVGVPGTYFDGDIIIVETKPGWAKYRSRNWVTKDKNDKFYPFEGEVFVKYGEDVSEKSDTTVITSSVKDGFFIETSNIVPVDTVEYVARAILEKTYVHKTTTFTQRVTLRMEIASLLINGKWYPFKSPFDKVKEGENDFRSSTEKYETEDNRLFEREENIVRANLVLHDDGSFIEAEGKGYVDREVSKPEAVEEPTPEPEPDPAPVQEPEPDPVEETPEPVVVVEEPTIDYYIEDLKSFVAWTMVMDGSDTFHDCRFFDCGSNFAADVDGQIFYFSKNLVSGDGYNSLNWDDKNNCWVPAVCGSMYNAPKNWYYSTALADGRYIDRTCDPNYASAKGNNNFSKDDNARTTWNVEAKAEASEYNGKKILTITAHKHVIDRDYKIVYSEK